MPNQLEDIQQNINNLTNRISTEGITDNSGKVLLPPSSSPDLKIPNNVPLPTQNTTDVNGLISFYKSQFDTAQKQQEELLKQQQELQKQQSTQTKPFLDRILGSRQPSDVRQETTTQTGIQPTEFFQSQKAGIAELETLNKEYNATVARRDQQIASVTGLAGQSIDFMNNQVAQINRNAAPELNRMAANINAKAATFEAEQNRFAQAQQFIDKAVQAATADLKFNVDMFSVLYEVNQDQINRLDTKYQSALKDAQTAALKTWETAVVEKNDVGKLMMENPQAGITINDTLAQAQSKIARSGGTAKFQLDLAQERRLAGEAGVGAGLKTTIYDTSLTNYLNTGMSPDQAALAIIAETGENLTEKDKDGILRRAEAINRQIEQQRIANNPLSPTPLLPEGFVQPQKPLTTSRIGQSVGLTPQQKQGLSKTVSNNPLFQGASSIYNYLFKAIK